MEPTETKIEDVVVDTEAAVVPDSAQRPQREFKKNSRKPGPKREPRAKSEFDQKIISIRRVTRVVTGGRRFAFSVAIVIGDRKGKVGVGLGKAGDTPLAIDKAVRDARKNMIKVTMTKNGSIPHEVEAKYGSSVVKIMKAPGKGVLAGSSVRTVLEFAGLKEVSSKIFSRSKNKINNAKAATKALSKLIQKGNLVK
jgi:small subunit ribosomal protein S5